MNCSEREQASLFRLIHDCARAGTFSGEGFLESVERHLGLRDTVFFSGASSLGDASEYPLAVRGRAVPMLPAYLGRYYRNDVFRSPAVERIAASRGMADLREIPSDVIAQHREYVDEFHGQFGTRTITLVKLDGRRRSGYVFALDFESGVPRRAVELLHGIRSILAVQLDADGPDPDAVGERLTSKEKRVAELVARGLSNAQIAAALNVKVDTVKKYLTAIYAACGVRSRTQLALALHR